MKAILLAVGCLALTACSSPESCPSDEVRTDLTYQGYSNLYSCISKQAYVSLIADHCMREVTSFGKALSDTWGNDEYNTAPVTEFADKVYFDCLERMKQ